MSDKLDRLVSNMSNMMRFMMCHKMLDKKEKSSNSGSNIIDLLNYSKEKHLNITLFLNIHIY